MFMVQACVSAEPNINSSELLVFILLDLPSLNYVVIKNFLSVL